MSEAVPQREADQIEAVLLPEQRQHVEGHAALRRTLDAQLESGRMPGAILLHGPRGIGKASLAFDFARQVLVRTGDESRERIGIQVAEGVYPNLFVLRRQRRDARGFYTVIRVEDVRALTAQLHQTRGRSGYRVCIVDAIDDCNASSANALLKVLEEPPAETMFILISHRPGGLLATIRSRCQSYAMRILGDGEVAAVLSEEQDSPAVRFGAGRPRRAFEYLQIGDAKAIKAVQSWLAAMDGSTVPVADAIVAADEREQVACRELVIEALSREAHEVAGSGGGPRLASTLELWENAQQSFADADIYNLDKRQTFLSVLDAMQAHFRRFSEQPVARE